MVLAFTSNYQKIQILDRPYKWLWNLVEIVVFLLLSLKDNDWFNFFLPFISKSHRNDVYKMSESCEIEFAHANSHLCDVHAKCKMHFEKCVQFVCGCNCFEHAKCDHPLAHFFVAKMATNSRKLLFLRIFKLIKVCSYTNSLVYKDSFDANLTNKNFQKISNPHLLWQ